MYNPIEPSHPRKRARQTSRGHFVRNGDRLLAYRIGSEDELFCKQCASLDVTILITFEQTAFFPVEPITRHVCKCNVCEYMFELEEA